MQLKSKRLLLAAVTAVSLISASNTMAAVTPTTWTGTAGDSLWTTPTNWSAGVPQTNYSANFTGAGNGDTSISMGGGAQPVNTVAFSGATTPSYTIGTSAGDALTMDAGGAISVASGVTTSQTIAAGITTTGTGISVTNAATGTTLTLSGTITGAGGVTTPSGGGGTILFTGNNNYSGNTTLSSNNTQTIQIGSNTAFGTGTLMANNTSNSPMQAYGSDITLNNPVTLTFGITVTNAATPHNLTFAGPIAFGNSTRTLTFDNFGQVVSLGTSASPSTITLPNGGSTGNVVLNVYTGSGGAASLGIYDVIQDSPTGPTTPDSIIYGPTSGFTTAPGNLLLAGANTYAGNTVFEPQTGGTFAQMPVGIGVSSVGNPGAIVSGPFGKGTVTINDANDPPIFVPYGADRTVANALTLSSGFFVQNAPTTGTSLLVDPAGTTHNLYLTGAISDPGKVITNNMQPGVALYLGSSTTSSTITMAGTTKLQCQISDAGAGTTFIYDLMTSTGALTIPSGTANVMNTGNNYAGATMVIGSGGTGSAGGAAAVGTGGTLGGTGNVPGTTTIGSATAASQGGIIAPGVAGPGTLNVGSMVLAPYGRYAFDYNATNGTVGAGVNDLIMGSGTLDLTALNTTPTATPFDLNLNPVVTGSGATSYILADFTGGIINAGTPYANGTDVTSLFTFSGTSPFASDDVLVVADPSGTGQDLELTATSVPEPASLGLVALGAIGLMKRRRK